MKKFVTYFAVTFVTLGFLLLGAESGLTYDEYSGSQCETCHSSFVDRGALHDTHVGFTGNCRMCHPGSPGSKPVSTSTASDATTFSCLGCHGRDYGPAGLQAAGLRTHHANNGVTGCSVCHGSDPTPVPEDSLPPHYGRSDVSLTDPCADMLDNDGDNLYDAGDSDCTTPVEPSTWGRIKALYKS